MPSTSEQDRFIVMAHFQSVTLNPDGNWSYSLQSCIEQFMQQYPDKMIKYDIFKQHKYLTSTDFYLFGKLKNSICKNLLHNVEEMQESIERHIRNISAEELHRVFENMEGRVNLCLDTQSEHFQNLL
ncbi:hypothetical protein FQA39_LY16730 [Lamprigera yunnana]|nr:hypothetical protein FQA39_LY16730 [Lamprigera yunnana]